MPDHELDAAIRRSIDSLNLPPEKGDWNSFESLLDLNPPQTGDIQVDHPIDQLFRNSLVSLAPEESASDWDLFEARLDEHPVDAHVREALAEFALPLSGADWPSLQTQLDAPFFNMLRKRLDGYETAYLASDWKRMQALLHPAGTNHLLIRWRQTGLAVAASMMLMAGIFFYQQSQLVRAPHAFAYFLEKSLKDSALEKSAFATSIPATKGNTSPLLSFPNESPDNALAPSGTSSLYAENEFILPDYPNLSTGGNTLIATNSSANPIEKLAVAQSQSVSLEPIAVDAPLIQSRHQRKRPNLRIALLGGSARSNVELNDQTQPGWLAGVRVEAPINQTLSIITGLFSAEKHFRTTAYVFENNNSITAKDQLSAFEVDGYFQTLEAPVLLRCYLPGEDKLKLYGQAGVVAMLALKESYEKSPITDQPATVLSRQPVLHDRRYTTYIGNVQGAIGLEYQLNNTLSLQVEPYFQLGLQRTQGSGSLGTTKKLYTSGVLGGVSVQL